MSKSNKRREQQIQTVCEYIDTHLDQALSLDQLSQIAICSKFHFQRVFSAFMGISATQYVLLARLKRASFRLAFEKNITVTDIAFIEHRGNPQRVFETAAKFIEWRKTTGLSPIKTSKTFGIPYGDPSQVLEEEFRFDICGSHIGKVPENPFGVKAGIIPAGRCAMVLHKGSHDTIGETIYQLYQQWLPTSGEELREFPIFFRYLNFVHEVDECDLLTEVYLPIL
ncbi:AraC family transcriptional regulator [Vibrio parahaemolyticus]|nr:AraC family transcriptional regulator [Vibrio parahaemolyticus]HCG6375628.1 AraC family transcriptional regulator [Vibrio parahaemolyticus]